MSKVNASIIYMLGSFIFLLSVIIPQFANAQEDIPKINEKQKEALELFSNSQSKHQQTSAVDIQQNNINSDKNILKKIIQQELQEKSLKEQGQEQQQQQQQLVKQGIQQQQTESDNNQIKTSPEVIIYEHANFGGEQQSIKESVPNVWSWNDKISSVIVKSGTWQFFEHENYGSPSSKQVGPGYYEYVEIPEFNIRNDNITAIKAISSFPQYDQLNSKPVKEQGQEQVTNNDKEIKALELFFNNGTQQQQQQQQQQEIQQQQQQTESDNNQMETFPEVIIYEHADFGGEQQHIKESIPNVGSWNDKISSVIVKSGTWQFFEHENYGSPSSKQVGPGNYDYVEIPEFNIRNDNITAIKVISSSPQGDHLNSKSLKEQSQEQVTNNDKEIKALELFFNKGSQQQEIQQHSNEGKQQQQAKAKTATTDNSKPAKEQGQEIQQQQQQQVKQVIQQKADKDHQQTEPFVLFFNKLDQEQQQQYVKQQQQQREQGKQELQEKLNEQKKQQ